MIKAQIELEKFINIKGKIIFFGNKKPVCAESTSNIKKILKLMVKKDKRVIILTDKQKFQIKGIIVCSDICSFLGGGEKCSINFDSSDCYDQIYMRSVSSIMTTAVRKVKDDVPLFIGVHVMKDQNIGTLPLIDNYGDLVGVITERHIAFLLADTNITIKVRDIMTQNVITCPPEATIDEVLKMVCGRGFRRLPIVEGDKLVGYLTVKDLINYFAQDKVINQFKKNKIDAIFNKKISTIMRIPVITIHPDASITEFAQTLKKHNIGALPVLEDDKLVGIITERDIVTSMTFPPMN